MYPDENRSPAPQTPVYTATDTAFAWLSFLFAFLLCQALPVEKYPFGGFLLIAILFVTGLVILWFKKRRLSPGCILTALSALVINLALLLSDTEFLINLSLIYCLASFGYFIYAALGNRIQQNFSDYIYIDLIKVLFILPFHSLSTIYPALFSKASQRSTKLLLKVLIGIGVAILPTALVFSFLSYDAGFTKIVGDIFSFDRSSVRRMVLSLMFTPPIAMYCFGLYTSSKRKLLHSKITAQSCSDRLGKVQILPQLTALVAIVPVLFLYVVFFISQWQYYVSGFTGVLPGDFSYAQYARQGFFELCSVSVINLVLIVAMVFLIKRGKKGTSVVLKIAATIFCLCTLVLISTAVAKLIMYIDYYGLTQKRIYAMWLMALIAIVFLLVALGQYLRKLKVVALCFAVTIVMFAGLAVCNVNALCAQYNADRYLSGSLETLDVTAMAALGDSAIPSLVEVAASIDTEEDATPEDLDLKHEIDRFLSEKKQEFQQEEPSVFSFNIPSSLARTALESYTPDAP